MLDGGRDVVHRCGKGRGSCEADRGVIDRRHWRYVSLFLMRPLLTRHFSYHQQPRVLHPLAAICDDPAADTDLGDNRFLQHLVPPFERDIPPRPAAK